jgi:hypothetical protein
MQVRSFLILFLLNSWLGISAAPAWAGTTEFSITATNVTMPSSGLGQSAYTVSGIPITGNLFVTCQYSGPATQARIPNCSYGPIAAIPVSAGQTATGTIYFYPYGEAVPLETRETGRGPAAGLALTAALLLGLGLRRRSRRWLGTVVLAAGGLAGVAGLSGCVTGMNGMTPGIYQYTITAGNFATLNNLAAGTTTTISVTVP